MRPPIWVASVLFWTLTLLVAAMTVAMTVVVGQAGTSWLVCAYSGWGFIARGWVNIEDDERGIVVMAEEVSG